jgi:hypothetical protein
VDGEIDKFGSELDNLLRTITQTITELKDNVTQQLEEFKSSYQQV